MEAVRTFARTIYEANEADAQAEEALMRRRLGRAQQFVNDAIGFDAWSRDLDDHVINIAFCVPVEIYDDKETCERLADWLGAVLGAHFLTFSGEWRDSSADEEFPESSRYQVDWCGSRCRSVNIGPHFYMALRPTFRGETAPCDPVARPCDLPTWTVRHEEPDCYTVNVVAE